ncbi:hypothetical protein H2248_005597 [Termitomyces sp. 'cryptogamus']|nr:hypothetical protein H2248_005586 [Termitomyces sp. 'cryptogamus']KAH0578058.1 hypothetical protein H2248_005597 [Termitomyces sp. 'cryptogamus']
MRDWFEHLIRLHLEFWKTLKLHKKPPKVLKVLVILIDTGITFLLLQAAISGAYTLLTGMYPTVVIYLINQQRCLVEVFVLSDPKATVHLNLKWLSIARSPLAPLHFHIQIHQ